ncbi:hypothetical protein GKZ89_11855 [Bacillus mangrovi]|uniref:Uncharacterized protein n=1 Tax=Metabacillus mangrovi TaxID=1491830 RepID=A0A7X2V5F0_9BACI|nr:hypothetical protein [Metabacillus mangrovi]MTH54104.1 hypothetical protein [Metabacillus mangrovi]
MNNILSKIFNWVKDISSAELTKEILEKVLWAAIEILIESLLPENNKDFDNGTKPDPL